jgi:CubicO group peptidase (beta-lactamase class C family)
MVKDEGGLRWLSHSGIRTGYGSTMKMCPEKKFAVIVLGNKTGAGLPRIADKAVEIALGLPPAPREKPGRLAMSDEEMNRLAGTYGNGRGRLVLLVRDGKLVGAQGGEFAKVGDNHYVRSAVAGMPESDFIFSTGLDGTGAYLIPCRINNVTYGGNWKRREDAWTKTQTWIARSGRKDR